VAVGLALGGELVELGIFVLELLFQYITLTSVELVCMFEFLDELLHLFLLKLQTAHLSLKQIQINFVFSRVA